MSRAATLALVLALVTAVALLPGSRLTAAVGIDPPAVVLDGPDAEWQLLISTAGPDDQTADQTHAARYASDRPDIVTVSSSGRLTAVADGTATITVSTEAGQATAAVTVRNTGQPRPIHFGNDVVPVLSRYGCNSSGCHGKAEGQNGFKLSVFGYDPPADHAALTKEARGRRVFLPDPERSLLLEKASGGVPHGGGVRIERGSRDYRTLRDWIAQGVPVGSPEAPRVEWIELAPRERVLSPESIQQLRVVAVYSDGRREDVTRLARFQSNNTDVASVDEAGLVTAFDIPGDVAVMAAYLGHVDVFRAIVPRPGPPVEIDRPQWNFIDALVDAKLQKLNVRPSEVCDDATFLRRVALDLTGTLPTAAEARKFLMDERPDKRMRLVDELLGRPEFASFWALKWADLLRVDRQALGHKGAYEFYRWIRDSFEANKPYDEFVRELLCAEGLLADAPAGQFYQVVKNPGERASTLSQVFLGVRIECAQCHHHPFDRWGQADYQGMTAFFTQLGVKDTPGGPLIGALQDRSTKHPRTGETILAHALGEPQPETPPEGDRRRILAEWMTAADNPWLARSFVNRVWADLLGRGLVEPVDDFRLTNPPTNPALLDALAAHFIESGYDVRQLVRTITASRTYQLSATPNETNIGDEQNYSRALFKRMHAEVLLDAVCRVTGVPEKFEGLPAGSRAIELWDSHVPHDFLRLFGRPVRASSCECERASLPSVAQVLHVLNSPRLQAKLSHADGRVAELCANRPDDAALIEELYLTAYARFPNDAERAAVTEFLRENHARRRKAVEDVLWSLVNTTEFLFNH